MNAQMLQTTIATLVKKQFDITITVEVTRPDEQFGDFATNIAMQLARELKKSPRQIAEILQKQLQQEKTIARVEIAGPGFINMWLNDQVLIEGLYKKSVQNLAGKEILVEFGDQNPFKAMHLGHLYTTIVGDAIARELEHAGADVKRLSYHGDVGMHIAKAMWALLKFDGDVAEALSSDVKIGEFYAQGATAYKEDEQARAEIESLNRKIYELRVKGDTKDNGTNGRLAKVYQIGYERSFAALDAVFKELGVKHVKRYVESQNTKIGAEYVEKNIGKVFEKSDGAIIYRGEKAGLHTRVFINSRGLPTYEAKDLGLAELKNRDFPSASESIIITASEQAEYFKVMLAALSKIDPDIASKTRHISHGFVSLTSGKMSSRHGIDERQTATYLLAAVRHAVMQQFPDVATNVQTAVYLAAVKYTFLRNRIGGDIVFDVDESVALEGNSGPYLQYAHARARSILSKSRDVKDVQLITLEPDERTLARKLTEYPEILQRATDELMPHHICTYLYELAQTFNRFYENNRVIDNPRQAERVALVRLYANVLQDGLKVLGIDAPERL